MHVFVGKLCFFLQIFWNRNWKDKRCSGWSGSHNHWYNVILSATGRKSMRVRRDFFLLKIKHFFSFRLFLKDTSYIDACPYDACGYDWDIGEVDPAYPNHHDCINNKKKASVPFYFRPHLELPTMRLLKRLLKLRLYVDDKMCTEAYVHWWSCSGSILFLNVHTSIILRKRKMRGEEKGSFKIFFAVKRDTWHDMTHGSCHWLRMLVHSPKIFFTFNPWIWGYFLKIF